MLMQPLHIRSGRTKASEALYRGIVKGKFEIAFPTRFVLILKFFRILPYALYFPMVRKMTGR